MGGRRFALLGAVCACAALSSASAAARGRAELVYAQGDAIYSLRADGSARHLLIGGKGRTSIQYSEPVWSPDGRTLAFTRTIDRGDDYRSQIMLLTAGHVRPLTKLQDEREDSSPSWQPGGKLIAFARSSYGHDRFVTAVKLVRPDGSGAATVIARKMGPRLDTIADPNWLPDGRKLAYTRVAMRDGDYDTSVYTVRTDGTERRRFLRRASSAAWSRDGRTIAYTSIKDRNGEECGSDECIYQGEVYVARGDGSRPRRLTVSKGDDQIPQPSPDGRRILFTSDRNYPSGDAYEVYSIGRDGRCLTWLTNGAPSSASGAWRPGSAGTPDPSGCGADGRPALDETAVPRRARGMFWLGRHYGDLLLSSADHETDLPGWKFAYEDCGRFDSDACRRSVDVTTTGACHTDQYSVDLEGGVTFAPRRGTVAAISPGGEEIDLFTGPSVVTIEATGARAARAAARNVYPYGRRPLAGARLSPARIPRRLARRLRRTVLAKRKFRTIRRTSRALHSAPGDVRSRLRMARAFSRAGGIRTTRCR